MLVRKVFISVGLKYLLRMRRAQRDLFDFLIFRATCSVQFSLQSNSTPRTFIVFFGRTNEWVANPLGPGHNRALVCALQIKTRSA